MSMIEKIISLEIVKHSISIPIFLVYMFMYF